MADEKPGPPGGKRRRPPTTIDVKATEVASEPVKQEPVENTAETSPVEPQLAAASTPAEPKIEEPKVDTAPEAPPAEASVQPTAGDQPPEATAEAASDDRVSGPDARTGERRNRWPFAAAAGAAAMLVLFLALWASGMLGNRDDVTAPLAARIATLEKNVRDLAARPAPAAPDQRPLADLTARVGAAEQAMRRIGELDSRVAKAEQAATASPQAPAATDQRLSDRIAALETATRALPELTQRTDAVSAAAREAKTRADAAFEAAQKNSALSAAQAADHKDIEALSGRVAALEQATKRAEEKIAATAGADRVGRLAFLAAALRSTVERGEPFAQELAAVKPLVDAPRLVPLEPFAASGVPRTAALARELSQLSGPMLSAAGTAPRDGGFMDRLQQNAERLVRIRPINEAPGDDPATVVARAEAKAAQGDLSGAIAELKPLPPAVQAPAQAWMKKAEAQIAALAAARGLADNAVSALGKAAP
jgi:hypothetical protein